MPRPLLLPVKDNLVPFD